MSSEQMPPEFDWIKPGVKMVNKDYSEHRAIAKAFPHWAKNHACWLVGVDGGGYWQCDIAIPLTKATVTLTLTREQAEALQSGLSAIRWCCSSNAVTELKKQIEEKLK